MVDAGRARRAGRRRARRTSDPQGTACSASAPPD